MRQLFYLLMILNLLLFLWIYPSEQQPEQLHTGHPAIGDLHIVSDDVLQRLKSDVMHNAGMLQEPVLQVEQKPLSFPHYLTPAVDETHVRAAKPDAISAPLKYSSPGIIVTSINGYEVVLSSLTSYPAAARIFDQLLPFAGVEAYANVKCGDEKCLFFDVSHDFDAGLFVQRDSAMMQKTGFGIDAADTHSAGE